MKRKAIRGIVKKNTMGRCYLIYHDEQKRRRLLKLLGEISVGNGRAVTAIGKVENNRMKVERLVPIYYPVRKRVA